MSLDTKIFNNINHLPHGKVLNALALAVHYLTYYGWVFIIPVLYNYFSGNASKRLLAKELLLSMILAGSINDFILQKWIARPRPFSVLPDAITVGKLPSEYSFPSGHTAMAFAFATTYILFMPKSLVSYLFLVFAVGIGIGRIYIGFHYPSDVLAGSILGIICAFLSMFIYKVI